MALSKFLELLGTTFLAFLAFFHGVSEGALVYFESIFVFLFPSGLNLREKVMRVNS